MKAAVASKNMKREILTVAALLMPYYLAMPVKADNPEHVQRLMATNQCEFCDLSGASFTGSDLSNAKLKGANLANANLSGVILANTDFTGANLANANLSNAVLNGANISGANLQFADLQNASLLGAIAREKAELAGAKLKGTIMPDGRIHN